MTDMPKMASYRRKKIAELLTAKRFVDTGVVNDLRRYIHRQHKVFVAPTGHWQHFYADEWMGDGYLVASLEKHLDEKGV